MLNLSYIFTINGYLVGNLNSGEYRWEYKLEERGGSYSLHYMLNPKRHGCSGAKRRGVQHKEACSGCILHHLRCMKPIAACQPYAAKQTDCQEPGRWHKTWLVCCLRKMRKQMIQKDKNLLKSASYLLELYAVQISFQMFSILLSHPVRFGPMVSAAWDVKSSDVHLQSSLSFCTNTCVHIAKTNINALLSFWCLF